MNPLAVVYAVGTDYRFRDLMLYASKKEFATLPAFNGAPLRCQWPNPRAFVDVERRDDPPPDIWRVTGRGTSFAASAHVLERLEPFISMAAELLPLESEEATGQQLSVINVLNPLDLHSVIDTTAGEEERMRELEQQSVLVGDMLTQEQYDGLLQDAREGEVFPVLYPAFIEDQLPTASTFFKIDRFSGDIFLLDREDEPDTLLRRIQEFELTGIAMTKVWSSQSGPEPLNLFRDV